jgi:hypothetical protein
VADHVAKHFKSRKVLERDTGPQSVDQADEAMEDHLHAVFDHQLGSLRRPDGSRPASEPVERVQPDLGAMEIAALVTMLRNPQTARQAMVLSEILSRPDHRW